jgi:hypothetical protein
MTATGTTAFVSVWFAVRRRRSRRTTRVPVSVRRGGTKPENARRTPISLGRKWLLGSEREGVRRAGWWGAERSCELPVSLVSGGVFPPSALWQFLNQWHEWGLQSYRFRAHSAFYLIWKGQVSGFLIPISGTAY